MAIGIFDSGIGGLTVYKKIKKSYPNLRVVYFADFINFPYGEKTSEKLNEYAKNITNFLLEFNVESIIIACNTASAVCKKNLENEYNVKFYSIINPICDNLQTYKKDTLSLIATDKTVRSNVYKKNLGDRLKYSISAPKLVEYAENLNKLGIDEIIKKYITEDMVNNTSIILGCTHFPLLTKYIYKVYPNIRLLDPADSIVSQIEIKDTNDIKGDIFYTSGQLEYFRMKLINILGREDLDVRVHKWNSKL